MEAIIISEEEQGERLDKILARRFEQINSRTYFQYLIAEELVLVNGSAAKKRIKLSAGDEVDVHFVATPETDVKPEAIPLSILYEDEDILVVNKASGMVVHPAPGNWTGTFVNALLHHCHLSFSETNSLRPGIAHRLDKETSGVLVAAKHTLSLQRLIQLFVAKEMHKEYLAVCLGNPGKVTIDAPIGRHPIKRQSMAVIDEGGKSAISHVKTEAFDGKLSVVTIIPETGRTHQIRVHLRHHGTPVLGDPLYGNVSANSKYGAQRQFLHAQSLTFLHPINGKKMEFHAPLPEDMTTFVKNITNRPIS